jgi:AcrR family transcriptional regulator
MRDPSREAPSDQVGVIGEAHVPAHHHRSRCVAPGESARAPLSCDRIAAAALRLVDEQELDELSMRRLGAELGVEAMSLYRYYPSKAALLDAVVCRALTALELPVDGASDWEVAARRYARSFRAATQAHPHLVPLMATVGPANETLASVHASMIALWRAAGFDESTATHAQCTLQAYLMGNAVWAIGPTAEADVDRSGTASGAGPGTPIAADECGPDGPSSGEQRDADFEFGLEVLLGGLRARIMADAGA